MITATVSGLTELVDDLRGMPPKVETEVINNLSQVAYDSAQRGAGRHIKTGALFQSLYNRAIRDGRSVGHDPRRAPHAIHLIFGTKPHKIVPNKRKALRWVGPAGFMFAKAVNHPGYRGDDYMLQARDDALSQFQKISANALRRTL